MHTALAILTMASVLAQSPPAEFSARSAALDALFRGEAAKGGSYVLRYERDGQVLERGYGHQDCARTRPMPADALIDSGSITKMFTAAAIYKLVEQGRLRLDDRLGDLLPGVGADKAGITVAQMLDGWSGLPDFIRADGSALGEEDYTAELDYAPLTRSALLERTRRAKLLSAPGTAEAYSNLAYQLLAAIIEDRSGVSYETFVQRELFAPAGLRSTGYTAVDFPRGKAADQCRGGTSWGDPLGRGEWKQGVSWALLGAGGMMTTPADLATWAKATTEGKLFRPDIQERFRAGRFFKASYERCRTEISEYAGSNGLTFAWVVHFPRRKETLVVASTRDDKTVPTSAILDVLCPRPAPPAA